MAGTPIVFWVINFEDILSTYPDNNIRLEQSTSITGDLCHYNIIGLQDNKAKRYFTSNPTGFYYCCPNDTISLSTTDIENITDFTCP